MKLPQGTEKPTKRWGRVGIATVALIALGLGLRSAEAGQPFVPRQLPGATIGQANTRWIAPYVLATSYQVKGTMMRSVRWFDEKGGITNELAGPGVEPRTDYIYQWTSSGITNYSVNGGWELVVPNKPGPSGYVAGTGDTFVHEFHPREGEIAVDVYLAGRLVGSVGPYAQYMGNDVQLAEDGDMVLLTWTTSEKLGLQTLVIGPDGKIRFQSTCEQAAQLSHPISRPVGGGHGVLMRVDSPSEPPVRFTCKVVGGNWITRAIGTNAWPMECTLPGDLVLFDLSIGEDESFQLFDCATGKAAWEISSPVQHWSGSISGAVTLDDMLLFVGRDFAAVSLKTGKLIAKWEPNVPRRDRGWFARRGDRLFFVTEDRFAELVPADIKAKRNGWQ